MSDSCNPMYCSLPVSSVHVISQERILEWVAVSFSTASSRPRNWTWVSCIAGGFFGCWATGEAHRSHLLIPNFQSSPPPHFSLGNCKSVLNVYESVSLVYLFISYFRVHIEVVSYGSCLSLSDLLHLVW